MLSASDTDLILLSFCGTDIIHFDEEDRRKDRHGTAGEALGGCYEKLYRHLQGEISSLELRPDPPVSEDEK